MSHGFRTAACTLALAMLLAAGARAAGDEDADGLTRAERAQLEEMAKATGTPVEQLIREIEENEKRMAERHAGAARSATAPAVQAGAGGGWLLPLLGLGGLAAGLAGVALALRAKRSSGKQSPAVTAGASKPQLGLPEGWLIDIHGLAGHPPRRLTDKPMVVGRTAGNDPDLLDYYVVPQATIGRRHAVIRFRDGAFWLVDQGSVNGCFVNAERVAGERQLRHGDRLKFHQFEFEFQHPGAAGAAVVPQDMAADRTVVASAAGMAVPAATAQDLGATLISDMIPAFDGAAATVLVQAAGPLDPLAATLPSLDSAEVLGEADAFAATMMAPSPVPSAPPMEEDAFAATMMAPSPVPSAPPMEEDAFAATMMAPSPVPAAPKPVDVDASAFFDDFTPAAASQTTPPEALEMTALPPEEPDFDTATTIMPAGMLPAALLEETARLAGPSADDMLADTVRMAAADLEATQLRERALMEESAAGPRVDFDATLLDDFGMSAPLPEVDLPIDVQPPPDDELQEPTIVLDKPVPGTKPA